MKLLPTSFLVSPAKITTTSAYKPRPQPENQSATFLSSFWRSYVVGIPILKRDHSLEKRKDNTVTETQHVTETIFSTVFINETTTLRIATTIWSTRDITVFQSTTLTQNMTTTMPLTVPASSLSATKAGVSIPTKADLSATASPTPSAVLQHHLPTVAIVGIVFGVLGLLGLVVAGLFIVRRFYRMYRRERVLRKQLQTENTEMPAMKTGDHGGD